MTASRASHRPWAVLAPLVGLAALAPHAAAADGAPKFGPEAVA